MLRYGSDELTYILTPLVRDAPCIQGPQISNFAASTSPSAKTIPSSRKNGKWHIISNAPWFIHTRAMKPVNDPVNNNGKPMVDDSATFIILINAASTIKSDSVNYELVAEIGHDATESCPVH
ncbi:hypothetical protein M8J77_026044 [Diaphorina citri]|nr:hypothetical protein M8J77_026044 [Diaphorina citri]